MKTVSLTHEDGRSESIRAFAAYQHIWNEEHCVISKAQAQKVRRLASQGFRFSRQIQFWTAPDVGICPHCRPCGESELVACGDD